MTLIFFSTSSSCGADTTWPNKQDMGPTYGVEMGGMAETAAAIDKLLDASLLSKCVDDPDIIDVS